MEAPYSRCSQSTHSHWAVDTRDENKCHAAHSTLNTAVSHKTPWCEHCRHVRTRPFRSWECDSSRSYITQNTHSRYGSTAKTRSYTTSTNAVIIIIIMNIRAHINKWCNFWRQKFDQEIIWKCLKIWRPHNRNSAHVECESKSDTISNSGDRSHFKITQTVPEQHIRKGWN